MTCAPSRGTDYFYFYVISILKTHSPVTPDCLQATCTSLLYRDRETYCSSTSDEIFSVRQAGAASILASPLFLYSICFPCAGVNHPTTPPRNETRQKKVRKKQTPGMDTPYPHKTRKLSHPPRFYYCSPPDSQRRSDYYSKRS